MCCCIEQGSKVSLRQALAHRSCQHTRIGCTLAYTAGACYNRNMPAKVCKLSFMSLVGHAQKNQLLDIVAQAHDESELAKDRLVVKLYKPEQSLRVCYASLMSACASMYLMTMQPCDTEDFFILLPHIDAFLLECAFVQVPVSQHHSFQVGALECLLCLAVHVNMHTMSGGTSCSMLQTWLPVVL